MTAIQRRHDHQQWMIGVEKEISTANDPLCQSIKTVFEGKVSHVVLNTIIAYVSETEKMEAAILLNPFPCLRYRKRELPDFLPFTPQLYRRLANNLLERTQKFSHVPQKVFEDIIDELALEIRRLKNLRDFTAEDLVPLVLIFLEHTNTTDDIENALKKIESMISLRKNFYPSLSSLDLLRLFNAYFSKRKIVIVYEDTIEHILNADKTLMPLSAMLAEIIRRDDLPTFTLQFLVTVAHDFSQALGQYPKVQSLLDAVMQEINNRVDLSGLTMNDIALLAKSTSPQNPRGIQNIITKIVAEINNRANSIAYTHKQFQELMTSLEDWPANSQIDAIRAAISEGISKKEPRLEDLHISI